MEKIFQLSVEIHGNQALESEVVVDTTGQEKNITFPTDTKLRIKVIARCWKIAEKENLVLRRSYRRGVKKLLRTIRFNRNKNTKLRNSALRRIKTIANALLNDIVRKLAPEAKAKFCKDLEIYSRAVNQKRTGKNKIYSLHEPEVAYIAKGKEHKKDEFGTKVALAQTITDGSIVGALNAFNEYDGNCLAPLLEQVETITGKRPEKAYCDLGFRGRKNIGGQKLKFRIFPRKASQRTKSARRRENSGVGARLKQ